MKRKQSAKAVYISTHAAVCGMYTDREAMVENLNPLVRDVRRDRVGEHDRKVVSLRDEGKDRAVTEPKIKNTDRRT